MDPSDAVKIGARKRGTGVVRVVGKPERPKRLYDRLLAEKRLLEEGENGEGSDVRRPTGPKALNQDNRSDARSGEYVVFCNRPYGTHEDGYWGEEGELHSGEDGEYGSFWHEADVLLLAAAGEVERDELTPAGARQLLDPYREVLSVIYTGEQRKIFDPARSGWSREDGFPRADDVRRNRPASAIFWYGADDLGIPGVGFTMWATPHPIFEVRDKKALEALGEAVADEYKIVVKEDTYAYLPGDVEGALETIQRAREE